MKLELSTAELQVILAPHEKAQAEVIRLNAEVARLNALAALATPTASGYVQDHQRDAIVNALTNVCTAVANGNKILAIKITRELTGLGLKEAKDVVEGTYSGPGVRRMG